MIFIQGSLEKVIQLGDKTRLDFSATFLSPDEAEISEVTITPESSGSAVDVTSDKYLDWAYLTEGEKTVTVSVTTDGVATTKDFTILALTESEDKLFSNDQDIISHEVDIYRFLRPGRSSFLDFHRVAQKMILDDLDQKGLTDNQGNKLTKEDIYDIEEVKEWSKYLSLSLIYRSVQSEVGDVYDEKAQMYKNMAASNSKRATIRLDLNHDDTVDSRPDLWTGRLVRR